VSDLGLASELLHDRSLSINVLFDVAFAWSEGLVVSGKHLDVPQRTSHSRNFSVRLLVIKEAPTAMDLNNRQSRCADTIARTKFTMAWADIPFRPLAFDQEAATHYADGGRVHKKANDIRNLFAR